MSALCILGITAQWKLRTSADLLPQSRSTKNGKYTNYSSIFHTFAWVKNSRRISLSHYAVIPLLSQNRPVSPGINH